MKIDPTILLGQMLPLRDEYWVLTVEANIRRELALDWSKHDKRIHAWCEVTRAKYGDDYDTVRKVERQRYRAAFRAMVEEMAESPYAQFATEVEEIIQEVDRKWLVRLSNDTNWWVTYGADWRNGERLYLWKARAIEPEHEDDPDDETLC